MSFKNTRYIKTEELNGDIHLTPVGNNSSLKNVFKSHIELLKEKGHTFIMEEFPNAKSLQGATVKLLNEIK